MLRVPLEEEELDSEEADHTSEAFLVVSGQTQKNYFASFSFCIDCLEDGE